ncbi:hypothetical protein P170DRAFT_36219 [Aspergillus steynii IBT 23096]|uniref:Zn(2)-C6 fungal-type domain-containing protein n=1 Tax=Aspergillus steynii IBT 23096 TaxID=1392250 RepID=A0A2I2GQW0_9EURO|nr:uncharacterized protein P170DRAFT_36219 [Aspergillus steynii IBT 23096]PLB55241.1 hypothetical protein P170DRAFT_36219 [Aspergillus steynii IBT 23096]
MTTTRSHFLGSCHTCRRRHVRCDRRRPSCSRCRALGVPCEGFSDQVRWIAQDNPVDNSAITIEDARQGARRYLYSEESRLSMSVALGANLVSGSIDASLAEIDRRSHQLRQDSSDEQAIGPFSVLHFPGGPEGPSEPQRPGPVDNADQNPIMDVEPAMETPAETPIPAEIPMAGPLISLPESLGYMDDFLHWSDILGLEFDQTDFSSWPTSTAIDPLQLVLENGNSSSMRIDGLGTDIVGGDIPCEPSSQRDLLHLTWSSPPQHAAVNSPGPSPDVLADAPFLLKHLHENVIALMVAMPLGRKSPWTMLNMPAAVVTLGDLTFLNAQNITHARQANLYGLLACSALHLTLKLPNDTNRSIDHWKQVTKRAFEQAKEHMQISLKTETQLPKKAKYKDQMMALCALTEFAIISGQPQHARCFLLDTERLVRLRGFTKRRISQKARLLHHVYTWHRIVGESTYVLHDYSPSKQFLDALETNFQPPPVETSESVGSMGEADARLDTFLRLETHASDRDLNIHERKDQETSLRDIHLEDSRDYPETLYKEIYGIPETWLSLVSQTTRLANVMETFRNARGSTPNLNFEAWDTLQRRSVRLEYMICSLNRTQSGNTDHGNIASKPGYHLLRALNAALVIFFYRRIYQVHPQILEHHVDDVIAELENFRAALQPDEPIGLGSIWPAFIAGCEATDSRRRDAIVQWLDQTYTYCRFPPFSTAKTFMTVLWRKQDECLAVRGQLITTWIDVASQERIWPILC